MVQRLSQGPHHLLVSQAINKGAEHRSKDGVEDRDHLVMARGPVAPGPQVDEHGCPIEEEDRCQMGGRDGQGLFASLSRTCTLDMSIGGHNDGEGNKQHEDTASIYNVVKNGCVYTGQFQQG